MRKEELFNIIGEVNEQKVSAAGMAMTAKKKSRPVWLKWGAMAACLCLVVGLAIPMVFHQTTETPHDTMDSNDGPASLTVNGVNYLISSHPSVFDELPDGFIYTGETNVGSFVGCPYYTNPDIPEWVYVYHEVLTDGRIDETGTLNRTEPHNAYVRYVDVRLRGKDLVCYNGEYYISMWSAEYYGDTPDVTREYYDAMDNLYGKRIEGAVPNGFELAGTAVFTGNDTIPTGYLASNEKDVAIYYNPDDPTVIFVETYWFTSTAEENGQTQHSGFNVYIRYDCPFRKEAKIIRFHDKAFNRSDLSEETIEWLEWYNSLSEKEQLAISSIPTDLYELCGYPTAEDTQVTEVPTE